MPNIIKVNSYNFELHRFKVGAFLIDWLSMVLRLRQHNIGYTADGFYRSDDPTNSVKALKEGG